MYGHDYKHEVINSLFSICGIAYLLFSDNIVMLLLIENYLMIYSVFVGCNHERNRRVKYVKCCKNVEYRR